MSDILLIHLPCLQAKVTSLVTASKRLNQFEQYYTNLTILEQFGPIWTSLNKISFNFFRKRWRFWWLLLESRARCGAGSSKCPCSNLLWYSFGQSREALGGAWLLQSFCSVLFTKSNTHIQPKKQGKRNLFWIIHG